MFLDDNHVFVAPFKYGAEAPSGTVSLSYTSTEKFQKNIPCLESILDHTRDILANFQNQREHQAEERDDQTLKIPSCKIPVLDDNHVFVTMVTIVFVRCLMDTQSIFQHVIDSYLHATSIKHSIRSLSLLTGLNVRVIIMILEQSYKICLNGK